MTEEQNKWQPISTAPKDGTEILVYEDGEIHKVAWLNDDVWKREDEKYKTWCVPGSWQDEQGGHYIFDNPSHWLPLPEPPIKD